MPPIDSEAADRLRARRAALIKRFIVAARALLMPLSPISRGRRGKTERQGWRGQSAPPQGEAAQGGNSGQEGITTEPPAEDGEAAQGSDAGQIRKGRFRADRLAALSRRLMRAQPKEPPPVASPSQDIEAEARRNALLKSMMMAGRSLVRHLSPISKGRRAAGGKSKQKGKASGGGRAFQTRRGRYSDDKRQSSIRRPATRRNALLNAISRAAASIIERHIYIEAYKLRAKLNPFRDWGGPVARGYRRFVSAKRRVAFYGRVGRNFWHDLRRPGL